MADEYQVALLQQGVSALWNTWRKEANRVIDLSGVRLDGAMLHEVNLSEANLTEADLRGACLGMANLTGADLRRANLSQASVHGANLTGADLRRANLTGAALVWAVLSGAHLMEADLSGARLMEADLSMAHLIRANLSGARLQKANLGGADLRGANLSGASLHETNLQEVQLSKTVFGDVNLSTVTGLETCRHGGPSIIDYSTLRRSGHLPLAFLRGVGLPDSLIELLNLNQPSEMYSCFISYSSKDHDFTQQLNADLQNNGVRCWFAPHDLPIGAKTWDAIDEAIKLRDKLLLILSENSISSDWVEDEVTKAFAEERDRKRLVLFPVRIDDAVMETSEPWASKLRNQRNIGDFRKWKDHDDYQVSLKRLLRDLAVHKS